MNVSAFALGSFLALVGVAHADGQSSTTKTPLSKTALPAIGSLRVDLHGNGRATVRWRTDVPTLGWVRFGTTPSMTETVQDPLPSREHAVGLSGLPLGGDVYYQVFVQDAARRVAETPFAWFQAGGPVTGSGFEVAGSMVAWQPLELRFAGPRTDELATDPNPFLDYRLQVTFDGPDGSRLEIPGFYDGDGNGGGSGRVWSVRFPPHVPGTWSFTASFRAGPDVAVSTDRSAGAPTHFDGLSGTFEVRPRDPAAPGFYRWGKLAYVRDHYLKFVDGPYFVKGGSNSPENLFAYHGFDNTLDQGGRSTSGLVQGLHLYSPHTGDWGPEGLGDHADPLFRSADTGVDARGLVGALNYLSAARVNSLFFLPMNLGGDGWEVCPFVGYQNTEFDKTHYDISKLAQWNEVLVHTQRRGILVQFVLAENEPANANWLDGGFLGKQRKLFYREMIARFGHLMAIKWNLSEECEYTTPLVEAFAGYIRDVDPYDHPVGFHVNLLPVSGDSQQYEDVLGDPRFATNSLQAIPYTASDLVEKWRAKSAAAGLKWVVEFDEQLKGLTNQNAAELRKLMLYDTLFSGGHVEWYKGYHLLPLGGDLRVEDFRTRQEMWDYTWHARKLLEEHTPFWVMQPMDELIVGESGSFGGAEVFAAPKYFYAVYYPSATQPGSLDLTHTRRKFTAQWYDPRTGSFVGPPGPVTGGSMIPVPPPPHSPGEDWVFLLKRRGF